MRSSPVDDICVAWGIILPHWVEEQVGVSGGGEGRGGEGRGIEKKT